MLVHALLCIAAAVFQLPDLQKAAHQKRFAFKEPAAMMDTVSVRSLSLRATCRAWPNEPPLTRHSASRCRAHPRAPSAVAAPPPASSLAAAAVAAPQRSSAPASRSPSRSRWARRTASASATMAAPPQGQPARPTPASRPEAPSTPSSRRASPRRIRPSFLTITTSSSASEGAPALRGLLIPPSALSR